MLFKPLLLTLVAAQACMAALTATQLTRVLSSGALGYRELSERVRSAGPAGQGGASVISGYRAIVSRGGALPDAGKTLPKATQYALCAYETTVVLEILEALTAFKLNKNAFTPAQVTKIHNLLQQDKSNLAQFNPSFEQYAPSCSDAVDLNGATAQRSYTETISLYAPAM